MTVGLRCPGLCGRYSEGLEEREFRLGLPKDNFKAEGAKVHSSSQSHERMGHIPGGRANRMRGWGIYLEGYTLPDDVRPFRSRKRCESRESGHFGSLGKGRFGSLWVTWAVE